METGSGRNLESNARSWNFGECWYQGSLSHYCWPARKNSNNMQVSQIKESEASEARFLISPLFIALSVRGSFLHKSRGWELGHHLLRKSAIRHIDAVTDNSGMKMKTQITRKPPANTKMCCLSGATDIRSCLASSTFLCPQMWNLETNTMGMVIFGRSSYLAASATRLHYDRLWIFGIWRWKRNPFLTPYTGREGERASLSDRVMCVCAFASAAQWMHKLLKILLCRLVPRKLWIFQVLPIHCTGLDSWIAGTKFKTGRGRHW